MNTGKLLETLVATVEELLLPRGFEVCTNQCIFNDEGAQIAEFDIEIKGKVGTTELRWLIECRDRPSQGPAPNSWIEQLAGRKDRFRLSKVIAVSSTGFAKGVDEFAREKGIELRTVVDVMASEVSTWFGMQEMTMYKQTGNLEKVRVNVAEEEPLEVRQSLSRKLRRIKRPFLRSIQTNKLVTTAQAFQHAISSRPDIYDSLMPDGGSRNVVIVAQYPRDDDHFVIETRHGDIRVREIVFVGQVILKKESLPVSVLQEYRSISGEEVISSKAGFQFEVNGMPLELAFHNINQSGETHILIQAKQHEKKT
jgi:hypothetical protein